MSSLDGLGYFAASLVLATFCAKTMVSLRALAIASNVAFLAYGSTARLWPIVLLHAVMLPLNLLRLREALSPSAVAVKSGRGDLGQVSIGRASGSANSGTVGATMGLVLGALHLQRAPQQPTTVARAAVRATFAD